MKEDLSQLFKEHADGEVRPGKPIRNVETLHLFLSQYIHTIQKEITKAKKRIKVKGTLNSAERTTQCCLDQDLHLIRYAELFLQNRPFNHAVTKQVMPRNLTSSFKKLTNPNL